MTLPSALSYDSEFMTQTNLKNEIRAKFYSWRISYFHLETLGYLIAQREACFSWHFLTLHPLAFLLALTGLCSYE